MAAYTVLHSLEARLPRNTGALQSPVLRGTLGAVIGAQPPNACAYPLPETRPVADRRGGCVSLCSELRVRQIHPHFLWSEFAHVRHSEPPLSVRGNSECIVPLLRTFCKYEYYWLKLIILSRILIHTPGPITADRGTRSKLYRFVTRNSANTRECSHRGALQMGAF
jgi:hypothetical protein